MLLHSLSQNDQAIERDKGQDLSFRKAVISLAVMEEKEPDKEEVDIVDEEVAEKKEGEGRAEGGKEEEDDIGSPFQWMDTVYV